jgi:hypothetical protein
MCPVTYSHFDAFALIGFHLLKIITKLILLLILNRLKSTLTTVLEGSYLAPKRVLPVD